jgi:hypothetical protein
MGQVFGINSEKEPNYSLVWQSPPYEVRLYPKLFVAEVKSDDSTRNQAFRALAGYIGVFGEAKNIKTRPIAMTTPVIISPGTSMKIDMTTPVLTTENGYMQFVLPESFKKREDIPDPVDESIRIQEIPPRLIAVNTFNGLYERNYFDAKLIDLHSKLKEEDIITKSEEQAKESLPFSFAFYNPPFAIPYFRRNEIWLDLSTDAKACPAGKLPISEKFEHLLQTKLMESKSDS